MCIRDRAIGLANMIRQLGGAVGIALINVYLVGLNSQIRGNMLTYINTYDTVSADRINTLTQNFLGSGYSLEEAQALAYKMLEGMLFKQQSLVSYDMGFIMVGFVILICIPVVLMIRYKKGEKAKVINDH